jgi:NAD(P)-dependent dehydrogenase (short-subunit alcohol dehydrogenase family)
MSKAFAGKNVLITGGTSGIGAATAVAFATAGATVVIAGRRVAEGESVRQQIRSQGGTAHFFQADMTRASDIEALLAHTLKTCGRLDIAFNNAGTAALALIENATEADYRRVFDTNVLGVLTAMKHEIRAMLAGGGGAIVNTSSIAGHVGYPELGIYVASKHAIEGLTKNAALELAARGIRVNAIAPAWVATAMADAYAGKEGERRDQLAALHPNGRLASVAEIAAAVLFLCSPDAGFITGESLKVDGGWTAR